MSLSKDFLTDEVVAATGSTQTDAAQLVANVNLPTAASTDGTKGVKLPAGAVKGTMVSVFNRAGSAVNLKVYSATSGGTIDGTAGSTANTIAQTKGKVYFCLGNDVWRTVAGA